MPKPVTSAQQDVVPTPICVDLDGTLVRTDLLLESWLAFCRQHPVRILLPFFWLLRGRAYLKMKLAESVDLDVSVLPFNQELLEYLRGQQALGHPIYLATASARKFAERIAAHLQLFSGVFATEYGTNLRSDAKADALVRKFGVGDFDYVADSRKDLSIWRVARRAILVNLSPSFVARKCGSITVGPVFKTKRSFAAYLRCIRPHHWIKNLLLFAPLAAAHRWTDSTVVVPALLSFMAFSFAASGTYVINDLFDLQADRKHISKRKRPLASGDIPITHGLAMAFALFGASVVLGIGVGPVFFLLTVGYAVSTLLYSFYVKKLVLLDVMMLAGFYTIRVIAGGHAFSIVLSFWMLAFTMFLFLSLALTKRYAEVSSLQDMSIPSVAGRDYSVKDIDGLRTMGLTAGYASIVVLALYLNSPEMTRLYQSPKILWLICCLMLYWVSWIWIKASRGELNEDPIVFAVTDRTSWTVGLLCAVVLLVAVY